MQPSIVMATRNGARYLEEQLESLARQTAPPFELVVEDDASDDDTVRILEEFSRQAPFPVHVHVSERRRGAEPTFFSALARCQGDVIAFCDQDDVWLPEKLAVCVQGLERTGALLLLHPLRLVDGDLLDLGRTWPDLGPARVAPPLGLSGLDFLAPGIGILFRRELCEMIDPLDRPSSKYEPGEPMLHDEWAFFFANALGAVQLLSVPLVLYRQHGANASGWVDARRERSLRPADGDYRTAAALGFEYERFLRERSEAVADPSVEARLRAAADRYGDAARNWRVRAALYDAPARRSRLGTVIRLLGAGAYRKRDLAGMGRTALAKDLVGGVVLRRGSGDQ
jgi:glycosyltransferase involved in cell wall biosynthesis